MPIIFIFWLLSFALHTFIWFTSTKFIPIGFVPGGELISSYHLPSFLNFWFHFDGLRYIEIARYGYIYTYTVYFPFFPTLIRTLAFLASNFGLSTLLISNLSFFYFLYLYRSKLNKHLANILPWLLIYPTSFYFHTAYTESLFFLLLIISLILTISQRSNLSALALIAYGATRLNGLFSVLYLPKKYLPLPLLGFTFYLLYLQLHFGDFLSFIHVQKIFGPQRQGSLVLLPQIYYRYFKILLTASHNLQYFVSLLELITFSFVFVIVIYELKNSFTKKNSLRFNLAIFSLANLIIPTLSGSFSSIPRYSLLSLSQFFVYSEIKNRIYKSALAFIFIVLHITLFILFARGYFVS